MDPYSQFFGAGGGSNETSSSSNTGAVTLGGISFGGSDPVTQLILIGALVLGLVYVVGRK